MYAYISYSMELTNSDWTAKVARVHIHFLTSEKALTLCFLYAFYFLSLFFVDPSSRRKRKAKINHFFLTGGENTRELSFAMSPPSPQDQTEQVQLHVRFAWWLMDGWEMSESVVVCYLFATHTVTLLLWVMCNAHRLIFIPYPTKMHKTYSIKPIKKCRSGAICIRLVDICSLSGEELLIFCLVRWIHIKFTVINEQWWIIWWLEFRKIYMQIKCMTKSLIVVVLCAWSMALIYVWTTPRPLLLVRKMNEIDHE